jgi:glucose-1-phosphate thymidylyltransferase
MKGVILAGGTGSRLMPLTKVTNKHLLPVGKKPMILHTVDKLIDAEITDIMIITGTEYMGDMISLLGSGREHGCNCTYRVQDESDGIAGALLLCEDFVGSDDVTVILGDNIFSDSLDASISKFTELKKENKNNTVCTLSLKEVEDPHRFGVAEIIQDRIVGIEEKPKIPKSNLCITGIYVYDKTVFTYIKNLKKSNRNEYEITDVNNQYIDNGVVSYVRLGGWWTDAGTHSSYHHANILVNEKNNDQ